MMTGRDGFGTRDTMSLAGRRRQLHRLDRVASGRLPFTFKVLLENLLRHEDGQLVTRRADRAVLGWQPSVQQRAEVDLHATRISCTTPMGCPPSSTWRRCATP